MRNPSLVRLGLLLALLACVLLSGCSRSREAAPLAREGVLDLAGYALDRDGPVRLDGQWEFYWDRLLTPGDFQPGRTAPEKTGYLAFPASWKGFVQNGRPLGGTGQATFRLRILSGPGARQLVLRLFDIKAACKLWANGEPLAESGRVGEDAATEQAAPSLVLAGLRADGQPLELVLQVSNHVFRRGGVSTSIVLASPGPLERAHMRTLGIGFFFAGSLLVMGVYHLVLYFWRKKDASPLYFGLYCLLWLGNFITSEVTEWMFNLFFPMAQAAIVDRISLICYIVSVPVGYRFFAALYPREFSRFVQHACDATAVVFGLITVVGSDIFVYDMIEWCYVASIAFILYCFVRLYACLRHGLSGALFLLCGFIFLGIVAINDMLYDSGLIDSVYLIQLGMFVFMLFQALALAQRFSHAFSAVERLSVALTRNNAALGAEMAERSKLEREIVGISEEERRRISHELHDGLCQQLTGARLRCSVLEQTLADAAEASQLAHLTKLLTASVDDAYNLSRGLWPVEHDPGAPGLSLADLVRRMAAASGIAIELRQEFQCAVCVNPHATPLYRIAQEAVANAVKHARPDRISVTLACLFPNGLALTVADDGIGRAAADPSRGGLGLGIMAHRARIIGATLVVGDAPEGGTVVTCLAMCDRDRGTPPDGGPVGERA